MFQPSASSLKGRKWQRFSQDGYFFLSGQRTQQEKLRMANESYVTLTWPLFRFSSSPNGLKASLWMSVYFSPGYNVVSPCISVDCASANSTNSVLELFRKILQLYWAHTLFCHSPWEIEYDNSLCGVQLSPCHYCVRQNFSTCIGGHSTHSMNL